jgi:hypothetical protein
MYTEQVAAEVAPMLALPLEVLVAAVMGLAPVEQQALQTQAEAVVVVVQGKMD